MNFGGDTNASTGFERTLYLLELPDTKETTLAEGLKVFADYAGGLSLIPEEIDKERGVIKEELAMYLDQPQHRVQELLNETLWPDQPLGRPLTGTWQWSSGWCFHSSRACVASSTGAAASR